MKKRMGIGMMSDRVPLSPRPAFSLASSACPKCQVCLSRKPLYHRGHVVTFCGVVAAYSGVKLQVSKGTMTSVSAVSFATSLPLQPHFAEVIRQSLFGLEGTKDRRKLSI
jgi:hypothetical protein